MYRKNFIENYFQQFSLNIARPPALLPAKVADTKLKLAPGQSRVSGQGWLDGIEVRNEANGPWFGRQVRRQH